METPKVITSRSPFGLGCWVLALWVWAVCVPALAVSVQAAAVPTLYHDYSFGSKDQVLDLGTQPLWVPTSAITEAMKRDKVLEKGLAELGIKIRFYPFRLGPEGNAFLGADRLDGMLAGDMPALTAAATKDVVIVTLIHQGFGTIIAKGVRHLADLRGKKVAYAPGSSTHFTLLKALQSYGVKPEEVILVPSVSVADRADDLSAGKVAAISAWDPYSSALAKMVPGSVVLQKSLYEGYLYFTLDAVQRHPQAVRMIIAAQIRAMGWMKLKSDNLRLACQWALDEHQRFSGKPAPLTVEEYAALIKASLLDVATVPRINKAQLEKGGAVQAKFEFLIAQGAIPSDTPFSKIRDSFNVGMISEVAAEPASYRLATYQFQDEALQE